MHKAAKLSTNGDAKSIGHATLEDGEEEDENDVEAGPVIPPDADIEVQGDEEGRFFGGGITRDTAVVLDFMEEQGQDEPVSRVLDYCHVSDAWKSDSPPRNSKRWIQPGSASLR